MSDAPTVLYYGPPPRPETHQDRVNRCRPVSRAARDIATALAAAQREVEAAAARIDAARAYRRNLVAYGTPPQIRQADENLATLAIEHEQFGAIEQKLGADLEFARTQEEADGRYIQRLADTVNAANAKFRAWLEGEYTQHAAKIAAGLKKFEQPAIEAGQALWAAQNASPNAPAPSLDLQPRFNGSVMLPGVDDGAAFVEPPARLRSSRAGEAGAYAR